MKLLSLLLVLAFLAGCAGPFPAAPELGHVAVRRTDSPAFYVDKVWLTRDGPARIVTGYIGRHLTAEAADTSVEIRVLNAAGGELQRATLPLAASAFHAVRHLSPLASFRLTLTAPPEQIAAVEVRVAPRS